MSCQEQRRRRPRLHLDAMDPQTRQEYLTHLDSCRECLDAATREDPTTIFALLPKAEVSDAEVDEIRRTVRTMRRVKAVEGAASARAPWRWIAGVAAAMLLLGIVLVPQFRQSAETEALPFAGAVGVGSGLIEMPERSSPVVGSVLLIGFYLSDGAGVGSTPATVEPASEIKIPVAGPGHIERDLRAGYGLRFDMRGAAAGQVLELDGFELVRTDEQGEESLLAADLRAEMNRKLTIGPKTVPAGQETFWLELTWSPGSTMSP